MQVIFQLIGSHEWSEAEPFPSFCRYHYKVVKKDTNLNQNHSHTDRRFKPMTSHKPFLLVVVLFISTLLAACSPATAATPEQTDENIVTIFVGPEKADCVGVGPMECLQIKYSENEEWQFFYSDIEGFTYEPGYLYELRVQQEDIANPPADASSIRWILVEEVSKTRVETTPSVSLDDTNWTLTGFGDGTALVTGADVTLTFGADGSVTGNASINRYNGTYTTAGDTLTFSPLASTKMGGDPALMDQETAYLNALAQASSFTLDGSTLNLYDGAGVLLLTFQHA
jgi:heat shock protein HslJ